MSRKLKLIALWIAPLTLLVALGCDLSDPVTTDAPAAPDQLAVTSQSDTTISVSWLDQSGNESGFKLEHAPAGSSSFTLVDTIPAATTSYMEINLPQATQVCYRIQAVNSAGGSEFSNTACGATTGTANVSFANQVYPKFASSFCTDCHVPGHVSRLDLTADAPTVYGSLLSGRVNTTTPCDSLILKRPSQSDCSDAFFPHTGGQLWPKGSVEYQTTLTWIQQGAFNN